MKGRRVSSAGIIRVGGQTLPDEDITGSAPSRANFGALSAAGAAGAAGAAAGTGGAAGGGTFFQMCDVRPLHLCIDYLPR